MTEGIIQEVFNSFRRKRLGQSITHEETLHLESELIEKIKLEILSLYEQNPYITGGTLKTIQKQLIGDNNE